MLGLRQRRKIQPNPQGDGAPAHRPTSEELIEMGFLDHLEELRWRIIKGMLGIALGILVCTFFYRWIIDVLLLGPAHPSFFMYKFLQLELKDFILQNRTVTGQFFAAIGTVVVVGVIVGSPIFIYQMWAFIEPGLYRHERSRIRFVSVFATSFFMIGAAFGYLIITPLAISFFSGFELSPSIANQFDITKYFGLVTTWTFGAGLVFEMPVVIYFLSKLGLVTPRLLRKSRRFAIVGILVLAALLTPPDPFTQILMAVPLMLLYEGSILISRAAIKKREQDLAAA
ncbi:MAG: twin-arginine translocase subunit TatC [Rhodothermales bacterium]